VFENTISIMPCYLGHFSTNYTYIFFNAEIFTFFSKRKLLRRKKEESSEIFFYLKLIIQQTCARAPQVLKRFQVGEVCGARGKGGGVPSLPKVRRRSRSSWKLDTMALPWA